MDGAMKENDERDAWKEVQKAEARALLRGLLHDPTFVDYFNIFLNQPVFGQRALFKLHSKTFIFNPPVGARIDNLRVIDWIHEERYNAFTRSHLSYEFQLCQQLRKISLSFRFDCKDPDVNGPKMLSVLVTNLMGSAAGMYLFRQFLRGTVGARVITCWMHVQTFRKTRNPERRMELFRGIRRYYLHPVSVVSAVGGCWTDIVASDLLNFPLIPVEDSVLKARINGSEPLSPRELEPRAHEALERVQSVLVAALQSYWLPCYILHVLGSQNVHVLKKLLKTSQDDCVSVDTVRKLVQRCSLLRTTPKNDDPAADDSRVYPSFSLPSFSLRSFSLPSLTSVRSCTASLSQKVRSSSLSSSFLDLDPATPSPRIKLPPLGSDLEGSSTACKSDQSLGGDHSTEDTSECRSWMDWGTEGESVSSEVTLDVPASPLSSGVAVGEEGELTPPVTKAKEPSPGDLLTLCGGFPLEPQPSASKSSNNSASVHQVEPPPIKKDTSPKPRATTPIDDDSSSSVQSEDSWSVRGNTNRSNTGSPRRDWPGTWQGGGPFGGDWVTGHRDNHTPACSRGAESRVSDASCPSPRLSKRSQDRDTSSLRDSDVTVLPGDSTDSVMLSAESSFTSTSTSTAYLTSSSYWSADSVGSALDSSSGSGAGPGPEAGNLAASGLQHHNKRASGSDPRDSNRNARKSHCSAHFSSERRRTVLPELYDKKQQDYDFYSSTYSDSSAMNTQRSVSLPALHSPREPFPFRGMCHPTFTPAEPAFPPAGRKTRRCSVSKPRKVRPLRETERRPLRETERRPLRETERRPLRETERRPLRETERRPLRETERRPLRETERKAGQTPSETVSPFKEASRSHTASDHSSSSGSLEMNNNYNKADGGGKGSGRQAKTLGNLRSVFSQNSSMTLSGDHLSDDDSDDHLDGSGSHAADLKRERKKKLLQERVEKERKRDLEMQAESMRKAFEGWKKEELRTANIANLTKIALHDMALKHEEVKLHSSLLIHYIFGARDLETEDSKTDRRTLCLLACDSSAGFPLRDYMLARNQDLNINYLDFWTSMRRYIQLRDLCCTGEVTSRENQTQIFRLLEQQVDHVSWSFLSPSSCWSSRDYLLSAKFRRQLLEDLGQKRHSTLINSVMDVIANVLSIAVTQYILHDIHIFHTIVLRSATPEPELKENSSGHVDMKNGLPVERVPSGVFKLAFRRQKCMKFKTFQDRRCLSDPWADEPETEVKHSALGKKRVRKTASVLGEDHRLRAFQFLVMVGEDINTSNLCDLTDLTDMIWSDFGSLYICTTPRVRNPFLRSLLPFQRLTRQQMETLTQVTQAILNVESEESVEFDRETHGLLMDPQHKTTFGLTYDRVLMLRKRRGAINISRPPRPKQFQDLLHEEYQYRFFRLFLLSQGPGHIDALNFWKACEEAKATCDVDERERLFEIIRARYLMGSRRENLLVDPDYVLSVGMSCFQAPAQVLQLQYRVREELEKKWWLEYVMNWPDLETLLNSRVGYDELWVQELLSDETGKDHVLLTTDTWTEGIQLIDFKGAITGDSSFRELNEPEHIMDLKDDSSPLARTRGRAKRRTKSLSTSEPDLRQAAEPPPQEAPKAPPKARATKRRMVRMESQGDEPPTTPLPPLHLLSHPSRTPPSDWEEGSGARKKKSKLKRSKGALPAEPSPLPSPPTPTLPVTSELEESARAKKPKPKKEKGKEHDIAVTAPPVPVPGKEPDIAVTAPPLPPSSAGPFPVVVRPGATFLPPGLRTIPLPRTHFESPSVSGLASSSDINTPEYGEGVDESSKTVKVEISVCPEGVAMAAVVQKVKKTKRDKKGRRKAKDFEDEAAKKRRKKRILSVWLRLAKVINAFTSTLRDPIEMRLFEEYLRRELERTQTNQGAPYNPDKPTLARVGQANMVIVVNKLPSDLRFWCEVDRYKHQVLEAEEILEEMPEEEENLNQFLAMRATAIINCYLNSVSPPMVQVNISDQEAYRMTYMYAKHGALHSLFHGAFVRLTPLLMTFWKQYQFENRNGDTVRAKGGKVEVAHSHVGNMPHLSEPTPDYTHCTVVDYNTTYVDFDDPHLRTGTGRPTTLAVSGSSKAPSPQSPGADSKLSPSKTEGEGPSSPPTRTPSMLSTARADRTSPVSSAGTKTTPLPPADGADGATASPVTDTGEPAYHRLDLREAAGAGQQEGRVKFSMVSGISVIVPITEEIRLQRELEKQERSKTERADKTKVLSEKKAAKDKEKEAKAKKGKKIKTGKDREKEEKERKEKKEKERKAKERKEKERKEKERKEKEGKEKEGQEKEGQEKEGQEKEKDAKGKAEKESKESAEKEKKEKGGKAAEDKDKGKVQIEEEEKYGKKKGLKALDLNAITSEEVAKVGEGWRDKAKQRQSPGSATSSPSSLSASASRSSPAPTPTPRPCEDSALSVAPSIVDSTTVLPAATRDKAPAPPHRKKPLPFSGVDHVLEPSPRIGRQFFPCVDPRSPTTIDLDRAFREPCLLEPEVKRANYGQGKFVPVFEQLYMKEKRKRKSAKESDRTSAGKGGKQDPVPEMAIRLNEPKALQACKENKAKAIMMIAQNKAKALKLKALGEKKAKPKKVEKLRRPSLFVDSKLLQIEKFLTQRKESIKTEKKQKSMPRPQKVTKPKKKPQAAQKWRKQPGLTKKQAAADEKEKKTKEKSKEAAEKEQKDSKSKPHPKAAEEKRRKKSKPKPPAKAVDKQRADEDKKEKILKAEMDLMVEGKMSHSMTPGMGPAVQKQSVPEAPLSYCDHDTMVNRNTTDQLRELVQDLGKHHIKLENLLGTDAIRQFTKPLMGTVQASRFLSGEAGVAEHVNAMVEELQQARHQMTLVLAQEAELSDEEQEVERQIEQQRTSDWTRVCLRRRSSLVLPQPQSLLGSPGSYARHSDPPGMRVTTPDIAETQRTGRPRRSNPRICQLHCTDD